MTATSSNASAAASGAFRRELRGTALIAAVLAAILGIGWVGTTIVGRTTVTLGPGVALHLGAGWGEAWVGPTDVWSRRWPIGDSILIVALEFDGVERGSLLSEYRGDVIVANDTDAVFDEPVPFAHPAGDAVVQHWATVTANGDPVVGELTVVVEGTTGVVLDARWPQSERQSVIDEIRRVVGSLAIESLGP